MVTRDISKCVRHAAAAVCLTAVYLPCHAASLLDVWLAASQNDPQVAAAQAQRQAGEAQRAESAALWHPRVSLDAAVARANSNTDFTGAHFSAPGLGASDGVAFGTSVNQGSAAQWALNARQPLFSRERSAQSNQLELAADMAQAEWRLAKQNLMLKVVQQYFDDVLATAKVQLLKRQLGAVEQALAEAKDRFELGDSPVTDTHEALARALALRAQWLAAQSELELAQSSLANSTGGPVPSVHGLASGARLGVADLEPLPQWQRLADENNPGIRALELAVKRAQEEVSQHRIGAAATLDLVAQAGHQRLSGPGDFGAATNVTTQASVGLQFSLPLYTGGYRNAKLEQALRLEDKARFELEGTRLQVKWQTQAAWLGLHSGAARIQALEQAVSASRARLDATHLGREVGHRTTLDVLNAENDASAAEWSLLQAQVEQLVSSLKLQALAGRLDDTSLLPVNAQLLP